MKNVKVEKIKRCCNCNKFILYIKHYSDSYLCSVDGNTIWCDQCFYDYDFSFLFDKEKNLVNDPYIRCLYCAQNFKLYSQERYIDQYKSKIYIDDKEICSSRCYVNITIYFKNNLKNFYIKSSK
jgi:hypothetical protein